MNSSSNEETNWEQEAALYKNTLESALEYQRQLEETLTRLKDQIAQVIMTGVQTKDSLMGQLAQQEQMNKRLAQQAQTIKKQNSTINTLRTNLSKEKAAYREIFQDYQDLEEIWGRLVTEHPEIAQTYIKIVKQDKPPASDANN